MKQIFTSPYFWVPALIIAAALIIRWIRNTNSMQRGGGLSPCPAGTIRISKTECAPAARQPIPPRGSQYFSTSRILVGGGGNDTNVTMPGRN